MKIPGSAARFILIYEILLLFTLRDDAVDRHSFGTRAG